ncbi:MAG: hypothetical protein AB7E05_11910 [Sphingobium sp.]
MIERAEKRTTIFRRAKAVEPHGIKALEYLAVFTVLRCAAMFIGETLDFFEPRDDAFFARAASDFLFRLGKIRQFVAQAVKVKVTHSGPHP